MNRSNQFQKYFICVDVDLFGKKKRRAHTATATTTMTTATATPKNKVNAIQTNRKEKAVEIGVVFSAIWFACSDSAEFIHVAIDLLLFAL